jgi:hypothetical protein
MMIHRLFALFCASLIMISPAADAGDESRMLETAVQRYWDARVQGDWTVVYDLLPEEDRPMTQEQFIAAQSKEDRGLQYLRATVGEVAVADDLGWVDVEYEVRFKEFPAIPPKRGKTWDVWRKTDTWQPIANRLRPTVPSRPPHVRPAKDEAALMQRAEALWQARAQSNWSGVYQYLEPGYRAHVTADNFAAQQPLVAYLSPKVEWAEVSGDSGRVKVSYTAKVTDPSLAKLDPKQAISIADWLRVEGNWYLSMRKRKRR